MPYNLAWAVVLLPLGAAGISYVTESVRRAAYINVIGTAASFALSMVIVVWRLAHISQNPYQSFITFWSYTPGSLANGGFVSFFHPQMGVLVDGLSASILPVVALVALLVQVYSLAYMRHDAGMRRFFVIISIFTFSMLGLVASPNLFQTYVMWEGVGVCSYLLIGHWWHRPSAAAAAKKAFLVTRIGDLALLLALVFTFVKLAPAAETLAAPPDQAGNGAVNEPFNFSTLGVLWQNVVNGSVQGAGTRTLVVLGVLVLIAAIGKSAQFPLHIWLPDAMEGPTPISALIHAATMVAAGVYLIARMYPLFLLAPHVLTVVAIIGAISAVLGAVAALAQEDIKRIIAYSTISHLGLMFVGLGVGAYSASIFHLFTHAWFKALLFLAAGNVIAAYGSQNIREMGGVRKRMRVTWWCMLAGCLSAAAIVPLAGFWSKDSIVAGVLRNQLPNGGHVSHAAQAVLIAAVCLVSLLGAVYPMRMFFIAFCGDHVRRRGFNPERVREAPALMTGAVVILALLATIAGLAGIEGARYTFGNFVFSGNPLHDGFAWGGLLLGGGLSLLGVLIAYGIWQAKVPILSRIPQQLGRFQQLAADGFRIDEAYTWATARLVALLAPVPSKLDREVTDVIAEGAVEGMSDLGSGVRRLQTGRIQAYGVSAFIGVLLVAGAVTLAATGHLPRVGSAR